MEEGVAVCVRASDWVDMAPPTCVAVPASELANATGEPDSTRPALVVEYIEPCPSPGDGGRGVPVAEPLIRCCAGTTSDDEAGASPSDVSPPVSDADAEATARNVAVTASTVSGAL